MAPPRYVYEPEEKSGMKKSTARREFFKLRLKNKSHKECQKELEFKSGKKYGIRTLKRWQKRLNETEWDLNDTSQRPKKILYKFDKEVESSVIDLRKKIGYSVNQLRIKLQEEDIKISEATLKRLIRKNGLSRGNKMEGVKLKWVRFDGPYPNDLWQIDGDQNDDYTWRVPVEDDCSRYCLGVYNIKDNTTEAMIMILEDCIKRHGKPKQILTDNGPEFGGTSKDSEFDKWCEKRGIIHIRSGIHKPTTLGKLSAIQKDN